MTSRERPSFAAFLAALVAGFAAMSGARASDACDVTPAAPHVVNVKDTGAKGDGKADDTAAIQKAINGVAGTGGTVYVPNGVYMVRATGKKTLHLGSKMTLKLADRAILKVIPNAVTPATVTRAASARRLINRR
jgi:polygalacturonase